MAASDDVQNPIGAFDKGRTPLMEPQTWRCIRVRWRRPNASDLTVAGALYYLLYLQPEVPLLIDAVVSTLSLRCIRVDRAD